MMADEGLGQTRGRRELNDRVIPLGNREQDRQPVLVGEGLHHGGEASGQLNRVVHMITISTNNDCCQQFSLVIL